MKKICFITGTRAEYGLLSPLMKLVQASPDCRLQVVATNMHLLPEYGETYREIEADGFTIDEKVPMRKPFDAAYGIVASMTEEMAGMNAAIGRLEPDLAVILGDRYEMLVAAMVCLIHRVPIAHIHGGEITEGAYDDAIRHSITKMATLHFPATEEYRQRIIRMGESPERVYCVGSLGVENIKSIPLLSRAQLSAALEIPLPADKDLILATYHPVTLGSRTASEDIADFLSALDVIIEERNPLVIFTMPNSDQGGDEIRRAIQGFCDARSSYYAFASLGMQKYLSLMHLATAVVGNSSSGIIEAPSAHVPTLNIGDRQKGRTRGASVIDCDSDFESVLAGLRRVLTPEARKTAQSAPNPYDQPGTAQAIFEKLISL